MNNTFLIWVKYVKNVLKNLKKYQINHIWIYEYIWMLV